MRSNRPGILTMAVMHGYPDVVKILIEHRANVDLKPHDETLLDMAQAKGHDEIVKLLQTAGVKSNREP